MRISKVLALTTLVLTTAVRANATTIDLKALAEPAQLGESAWNPLSITADGVTVTFTGLTANDVVKFAYLDSGNAGLGVCNALITGATAGSPHPGSSANECQPSSDDNVTAGEKIRVSFSQAVVISQLAFNNNHDGDTSLLGNAINIGGSDYTFVAGNAGSGGDWLRTAQYNVAANTSFEMKYVNETFYLSKMTFQSVPDGGTTLQLLGLGLAGLGLVRRRLNRR
jgi:VPDSG-CTERM motif